MTDPSEPQANQPAEDHIAGDQITRGQPPGDQASSDQASNDQTSNDQPPDGQAKAEEAADDPVATDPGESATDTKPDVDKILQPNDGHIASADADLRASREDTEEASHDAESAERWPGAPGEEI